MARGENKPTIVMCVTAGCPCSRASVGELERVYAKAGGRAKIVVVFREAEGTNAEKSELWGLAGNVPGVERLADPDGAVCGAFKALTSGQVLVFSKSGKLVYSGGITPSRGHAGDSEGGDAVVAAVMGEVPAVRTAPVFGCALP